MIYPVKGLAGCNMMWPLGRPLAGLPSVLQGTTVFGMPLGIMSSLRDVPLETGGLATFETVWRSSVNIVSIKRGPSYIQAIKSDGQLRKGKKNRYAMGA